MEAGQAGEKEVTTMSQQAQQVPAAPPATKALTKIDNVRSLLERSSKQLAMALPRHIKPDHLLRVVVTAVQMTPKLLDCDPVSLLRAVMQAAQLGLEPNDGRGHAYLIPFKDQVQLIPGYKGLIDLARRSDAVGPIWARVAREGDTFRYAYGTREYIEHQPRGEEAPLTHAYAVASLKGYEEPQFEVMLKWEIDRIRDKSQGYLTALKFNRTDHPWQAHYDEMAKKTAIRRLCKLLPQSLEIARAVALDDEAEAGTSQRFDENIAEVFASATTAPAKSSLSTAVRTAEAPAAAAPATPAAPANEIIDAEMVGETTGGAIEATAEPDPRVADFEKRIEKATTVSGIKGIVGDAATADLAPADFQRINQMAKDRITKASQSAQAAAKAAEGAPAAAPAKAPAPAAPATTRPADDGTPKCGAKHVTGAVCGRAEHPPDEECSDTKRGIQWLREVAAKPTRTVAPNELFQPREPGED